MENGWVEIQYKDLPVDSQMKTFHLSIKFNFVFHANPYTPDQIYNSPHCQPHNSYNVSSENLVLDQLITHKLIFFFFLITYLVNSAFVL